MGNLEKNLDNYLGKIQSKEVKENEEVRGEEEVCDMQTGECYTIRSKDGLIEKVNKTMKTEDGRTLLMG
tara:strand:- start:784 stop:990 length:207 start_codon:yes stop_codon:yes gene_type:complete